MNQSASLSLSHNRAVPGKVLFMAAPHDNALPSCFPASVVWLCAQHAACMHNVTLAERHFHMWHACAI